MTVNFIAFCMKYLIDLFILFPHILHLFQLLDVGVFAPLKCTLVEEIDIVFRLDSSRILCVDCVLMFIGVKSRALISSNVLAG